MVKPNKKSASASEITIYTSPYCGFCFQAKNLLGKKGVEFTEINVTLDPAMRKEMVAKAGATSVPQIFAGDQHVGDCDEIHRLEARGALDHMLGL